MHTCSPRSVTLSIILAFVAACGSSSSTDQKAPVGEPDGQGKQPPEVQSPYLGGTVVKDTEMSVPTSALTGDRLETGDTVACMDISGGKGKITRLELFEYYEALELGPRDISLGDRSLDPWTRAATVARRLEALDRITAGTVVAMIQSLKAGFRELPSAKLFGLPAADSIISLPQECFLIQAAIVAGTPGHDQLSLFVDSAVWQAMNSDQQTGLILHEALKLTHGVTFKPTTGNSPSSAGQASETQNSPQLSDQDNADFAQPAYHPDMTHKSFRDLHLYLVDIQRGFSGMSRSVYIEIVRRLGQKIYAIGDTAFDLSHTISFHDDAETKVKSGYISFTLSDAGFETALFQPITARAHAVFYPSGKIKSVRAGHITATTNGIPSSQNQFDQWTLKDGRTALVAGNVTFDEGGHLIRLDFGFVPATLSIETADASIKVPPPLGSVGTYVERELQSFQFESGKPYRCSRCDGRLTFPKRTIKFTETAITHRDNRLQISSVYEHPIELTFANKTLKATSLALRADGSLESMSTSQWFSVTCGNGQTYDNSGLVTFDDQERILTVGGEAVDCRDYVIRVGA